MEFVRVVNNCFFKGNQHSYWPDYCPGIWPEKTMELCKVLIVLVELRGLEPLTSSLPAMRSPS